MGTRACGHMVNDFKTREKNIENIIKERAIYE